MDRTQLGHPGFQLARQEEHVDSIVQAVDEARYLIATAGPRKGTVSCSGRSRLESLDMRRPALHRRGSSDLVCESGQHSTGFHLHVSLIESTRQPLDIMQVPARLRVPGSMRRDKAPGLLSRQLL